MHKSLVEKVESLSEEELEDLKRASEIYKFDLVTNMVGEFPELQGIMGEKNMPYYKAKKTSRSNGDPRTLFTNFQ